MKKINCLLLALIALCLVVFVGYRAMDRMRTDSQPPVIHIDPQPIEISVNAPKGILVQDVTAEDDVDGDVTGSVLVEDVQLMNGDGDITVTYAAFDSSGNVAKLQRQAKYTNYRSPRFTLDGPLVYTSGESFDPLKTIGAKDVLDGEIPHRVRATLTESTPITSIGTHMVEFKVTNTLGDTATEIFPVEVCSAEDYEAKLTLKEYLIYLPVGGIFNAKFYPDTVTYQNKTLELGTTLPENYTLEITGEVDTQTPGVYPVEYRLIYTELNVWTREVIKEYTGYSKLIVVVEG